MHHYKDIINVKNYFDLKVESIIEDPKKLKALLASKRSGKTKEPMSRLFELLRDGIQIAYKMAGKNDTDFETKTLKMISPRFLSLMPDDELSSNNTVSRQFGWKNK